MSLLGRISYLFFRKRRYKELSIWNFPQGHTIHQKPSPKQKTISQTFSLKKKFFLTLYSMSKAKERTICIIYKGKGKRDAVLMTS